MYRHQSFFPKLASSGNIIFFSPNVINNLNMEQTYKSSVKKIHSHLCPSVVFGSQVIVQQTQQQLNLNIAIIGYGLFFLDLYHEKLQYVVHLHCLNITNIDL